MTLSSSSRHAFDTAAVFVLLVAGLVATVAFDLFGQWLSPTLGFARLAPEPLATQTLNVLFGDPAWARTGGTVLHWVTGIVLYPLGYVLIALPIARAVVKGIPWQIVAAAYGVVLWVFALYVMAHLVAGNPPFLAFTGITWVALVGHVLYALVVGLVVALRP
jgi:hypothetical protein